MTMHLQTALNNVSSFIELGSIVKNAKEDLSFFGGRYIYVEGYEGTVDIDALARHCMALQDKHEDPNIKERKIGKKIIPLINKLHESNYSRYRNILTKIFTVFRDFLSNAYIFLFTSRGTWELWDILEGNKGFFDSYTYAQYLEVFGNPPQGMAISTGDSKRWYPPNYFSKVGLL